MLQAVAAPPVPLAIVAYTVAVVLTWTDRLPGRTAAASWALAGVALSNRSTRSKDTRTMASFPPTPPQLGAGSEAAHQSRTTRSPTHAARAMPGRRDHCERHVAQPVSRRLLRA